jgi:hypothetical protein
MSQASATAESMSKEELEALGEEIATFAARVDVATHALITKLRQFDEHEGWARADFVTCAHWLSWRTGIGLNAAREKVRVARALGELPRTEKLFSRGELSYSKVRAITRVATPEQEEDFVDIALHSTASQTERLARAYQRTHDDKDDTIPKPRRYVRRSDSFGGMVRIEMQLPPEEAELVWEALKSAMDADGKSGDAARGASNMNGPDDKPDASGSSEGRADASVGAMDTPRRAEDDSAAEASDVTAETSETAAASRRTPASTSATQQGATPEDPASASAAVPGAAADHERVDASAPTSERATESAIGPSRVTAETRDGAGVPAGEPTSKGGHDHVDGCCAGAPILPANDGERREEARADAMVDLARAYLRTRSRTLGSGYELVVITTKEQLAKGRSGAGGVMRNGTPLPLDVARMLACDSARVNMTADETGALLDVGRSTRTIPPAIARALWIRDGSCRVPGCCRRRHLQAHHIEHWVDGGATCLANLMLVCAYHHKCIHEGRLFVEVQDGKLVFRDAQGKERLAAPPSAATGEELEALERFLRDADLHLDPSLNEPRWDGTPLDLDDALAWMSVADQTRAAAPG